MDRNQLHSMVDLGVRFGNNLTFREHVWKTLIRLTAYSVLLKKNYLYRFILLYKAMVHSHIEFANSVWCPYKLGDIKEIEKSPEKSYKTDN